MSDTLHSGPGWVENGDRILHDRHDFREWVEWPGPDVLPLGVRVRHEFVSGSGDRRFYVHPDDVSTDPYAELVERIASSLLATYADVGVSGFDRATARGLLALVREHDKADR